MKIVFEKGLPGFENHKNFEISEIEENPKFKVVNSMDDKSVGFIAVSPFDIKKDYEIKLDADTINLLKIDKPEDVLLLNLVTLGKKLENSTVNLKAPLVMSVKNKLGVQLILQDDKYDIKEPLIGCGKDVSNF
ncbi:MULTISPECIES: flagellar assembly protein FliW [Paraclostridium]|uniref:Flagellar assembly factor FliW n=1 Tax=Paraclostridium benzoelyticum TaxID=1629550 RepID=A0A0M3DI85_9FIRM|nr:MULTISPECIES: flagellar assembly protein FliW [Paraclostridium]KKY01097.1 flagellar assembly protein FliW [Paraclostridium benzoelyticum]MCU9814814.1 flagellar assembly protein FliW [Paraclostridium sp. AKS73]MDM8128117.1 flagellar assembly protein FliW [Paraclostridium benzoelyticum]OXX85115.1 flagellar assembly protein FliW [Paraclostridium benzoelyticum]